MRENKPLPHDEAERYRPNPDETPYQQAVRRTYGKKIAEQAREENSRIIQLIRDHLQKKRSLPLTIPVYSRIILIRLDVTPDGIFSSPIAKYFYIMLGSFYIPEDKVQLEWFEKDDTTKDGAVGQITINPK